MKLYHNLAKPFLVDAAILGAFIIGQETGEALILNASLFFLWALAITVTLIGVAFRRMAQYIDQNDEKWNRLRSNSFKAYNHVSDLVIVLTIAAYGHFWLAGLLLAGKALLKGQMYPWARGEEP